MKTKIWLFVSLLIIAYLYGYFTPSHHLPPFRLYLSLKEKYSRSLQTRLTGDSVASELLHKAFRDPLYDGPLLSNPCKSYNDIYDRVMTMFVPDSLYKNAYSEITLSGNQPCRLLIDRKRNIFDFSYHIDKEYHAYAYFTKKLKTTSDSSRYATVVIPGTGLNQASLVYENDPHSPYGAISRTMSKYGDVYIVIKPNENLLAIHDGAHKLSYDFITTFLLNKGGSYSSFYIINSLAVVKSLKSQYDKVIVVGFSQGGHAALLNSLQSHPDITIVSSGFSIKSFFVHEAAVNQIIIPGLDNIYSLPRLYEIISSSKTTFLFTYGKFDSDIYKAEACLGFTRDFFAKCQNVQCISGDFAHTVPVEAVDQFLGKLIYRN